MILVVGLDSHDHQRAHSREIGRLGCRYSSGSCRRPYQARREHAADGSVAAGRNHSCTAIVGLSPTPWTVSCWGYNNKGQIGDGSKADALSPVSVKGVASPRSLAAGEEHTCAVR